MTEFGPHGWQTQFALGAPGETQLDAAGDSTNRTVPANASHRSIVWNGTGVLTLSMLLPANWQGSAIGTILLRDLADLEGRTVTLAEPSQNQNHSTVEIRKRATALQFSSWFVSFDSANVQDDGFRSWHKYTISLFTSSPGNLSISMAGFSYSLDENVSGLGPSVEAWRNASLSSGGSGSGSGPGDGVLSVPLTYRADLGGVAIDGSVVQSPAIIDEVVTIPDILLPDATVEIVTSHSHLFGTSSLDAAALNLYASDGRIWGYSVAELTGTPEFFSVDDPGDMGVAGVIRLDHNASSVNVVGSSVEITWVLRPDWTVDDVASITVFTEASDATGRIWGPASAIIGAGGSQAIENDLEIIAWTIVDESDRNLLATWDTSYPFYVQPGANLSLTGRVRFEGIQSATVATELWAGAIEVSAGDTVWTTEIGWLLPDDTWIVQVAIPAELADSEDITNLTIKPVLVRVGPIDRSRIGAEDATTLASATIRIDRITPGVGPLLAQGGGGLRPLDGNTWSPERPLVLSVYLNEVEKFGQTLRLYEWHEAIDDTDNDGIADSHEYQERVRMVGSSILQNQEIDLGAVELQASCCGERISFYIEGEDHSGRAITGGGGPGLENDLATLIIEADVPTVARREDVSIDSTDDYLLLGVKHTLTFKLQDGNGINSLDNVTIYLAGESSTSGALYWDPLLNELTSSADSGVQPIDSSVFESNGNEATISVSFALDDRAPSDWRVTIQSPAIVIFEEGQRLDLEIDQLPNLAWRFDTRTEWVVDSAEDLTAPYGQFYDGSLFIHDGDLINLTAHLIHERTRLPIDLAPVGRSVSIDAGAGVQANVTIGLDGLLNFEAAVPGNGGLDADGTLIATVQNTAEVGWPALHLPLILDRTAPIINFLGTSLVSVNTDLLGEQLVAFTITERGGMGDEKVGFNWRFQRSGIEMLGMTGTATLGPAVDNGDLWDISERVDMRVSGLDLLRDGDQLVVWVTGTDLAGNALVGEGSDANVRSPHLRIIWFDPTIDTVLIAPQPAQFGDDATFDVRLRDLGNGGGTIDLSLWAWEDDGSGVRWIELARTNVTLAPGGVAEAKFSVEMWREGDLSLLLAIDDDIEGGSALPSLHVNPGAGSAGFLGNVVAGEAASIGLLILVFTGIGFMLGVIALRGRDEDVDWDELEDIDYESDADEAVAENVGETRDDGIVNYSGNISGNISERGDATKSRNQPSQKAEIKGGKSRDQQPPARPRDIWPEPPAEFPSDSSTISSDDGSEPGSDEEEE